MQLLEMFYSQFVSRFVVQMWYRISINNNSLDFTNFSVGKLCEVSFFAMNSLVMLQKWESEIKQSYFESNTDFSYYSVNSLLSHSEVSVFDLKKEYAILNIDSKGMFSSLNM